MSCCQRKKIHGRSDIRPGTWNVFPTVHGDHMWLQGGLTKKHDVREFYLDLLGMINEFDDTVF